MREPYDVLVIGAGIVGLALARSHAIRGRSVLVVDREERTLGATIRNFGLVWPVGQPPGTRFERARQSAQIWNELAAEAGLEIHPTGSLTLARSDLELRVLREFAAAFGKGVEVLGPEETCRRSPAARPEGLAGALFSPHEHTVNPRTAPAAIVRWLQESAGVEFRFGLVATRVEPGVVTFADGTKEEATQVFVCSGPDLRTLFPRELAAAGVTVCKLQMLRTAPQPEGWKLGPALCAGLTMAHYDSFVTCPSLEELKRAFELSRAEELRRGVHVLVSQNGEGGLTLGDTHEYGASHDPFQRAAYDRLVLAYLDEFARIPERSIVEHWTGYYPKLAGRSELVLTPMPGVTLVNALGGAGMTLSFGLAEEIAAVGAALD
jgi:D-hydroxyproline dehydrogenase subunit beta